MAYCINCGQKLVEGAKFCAWCGVSNQENNPDKRRHEFVGNLKRCPSCGEEVTSFTAICPACGHEINSQKVSDELKSFVCQINKCEELIANSQNKKEWSSWGDAKQACWIIANVLFMGIPLVVYNFIIPMITIKITPHLSKEEKQMASLIENYTFPNNREAILEVLVYVKEKIDFISKQKLDSKAAFWMRLWCSKAEQLKQKADLLFPDDRIVKQSCKEILADEDRINTVINKKTITGVIGLAAAIMLVLGVFFFHIKLAQVMQVGMRKESNVEKTVHTVLEIPETELSNVMPQIKGRKGEIVTNNAEYFSVTYYEISDSEFENYKKLCQEEGYVIDIQNYGSLFEAFNSDGYKIRVTYDDTELDIKVTDDMEMYTVVWPSSKIAKQLPKPKSEYGNLNSSSDSCIIVYIGNTTREDFNDYIMNCIEKGFDKEMSRTDDHFHADNKGGYHVKVEYRGFDTMLIRIENK